jgi:hypothetical protein
MITKLQKTSPSSKRYIAREYDVLERAICKIWKDDSNKQWTSFCQMLARKTSFWSKTGQSKPSEDTLYEWLDAM